MSGAQFGQQYSQAGVQQMGTPGVNGQQLQNKTALSNNLPQFSTELKGAGSVPNMVSVKPSLCFPVCVSYQQFVSKLHHLQPSATTVYAERGPQTRRTVTGSSNCIISGWHFSDLTSYCIISFILLTNVIQVIPLSI